MNTAPSVENISLFELPDFSVMTSEHLAQRFERLLTESKQALAEIVEHAKNKQETTQLPLFHSLFTQLLTLDETDANLQEYWSIISHLNAVKNTPEIRALYQQLQPQMTQYYTQQSQNEALYQLYVTLSNDALFSSLSQARQRAIELALLDFKLSGIALTEDKQQTFANNTLRLAEQSTAFSNNVLDATASWSYRLNATPDENGRSELSGFPDSALKLFQQTATEKDQTGYVISLDAPSYLAVMLYADAREVREKAYLAFTSRCTAEFGFDNSQILLEMLALRQQQAHLLDFPDYAHLSLATKMAPSVEDVNSFLADLAQKSKPSAQVEIAQLAERAREAGIETLQPWDVAYFTEKLKQQLFNLSSEALKPYFPIQKVLSGLFEITQRLYGIEIKAKKTSVWHDEVMFFEVYDQGVLLGGFYFDLYARTGKRSGAWMSGFRSRMQREAGLQLPVAFMVCNFNPPIGDEPAQLTHQELVTLFHEFGHGLHHLLTEVDVMSVAGVHGVAWDAVELPSQMMEFWCWNKDALALLSEHVETKQPLPDALLTALLDARYFQSALMMLRQLEFSMMDMQLHQQQHLETTTQINALIAEIRSQVSVLLPPASNQAQNTFTHIFAGGYSAGYYSYKWAEVLAADAFDLFDEEGVFNSEIGQQFRENILAVGGSVPILDAFIAFRGRAPSLAPLLKHSGLAV